jgi:VanZ family protein
MMPVRDFVIYWLPPLAWMAFIFPTNGALNTHSTSHIIIPILKWLFPQADSETIHLLHIAVRKAFHIFNYAFLTFLLYRGFRGRNNIRRPEWLVYAGIIAIGYGALDEFIQTFIPSRTGSLRDWLIDSAGVVVVCGIAFVKNKGWIKG